MIGAKNSYENMVFSCEKCGSSIEAESTAKVVRPVWVDYNIAGVMAWCNRVCKEDYDG